MADDSIEAGSGYSGGTIVDVTGTRGYGMTADGWGAAGASGSTVGATCSGQISVVFKWHGDPTTRPRAVLIEQICTATAYNIGGPGTTTGNVSNGALGDDALTEGPPSPPYIWQRKKVGFNSNGTKIKHYSIVTNPGTTLETITLSPAANANAGNLGTASVYYQVNVYPLDIVFTGGIGENHEKQYLIGQLVSASLSSSVLEPDEETFEWSPSGSYYFKQFAITSTTGHKVDATEDDLDNESFALCFSAPNDVANLHLSVHLVVPTGSKPSAGLDLEIDRDFVLQDPTFTAVSGPGIGDFKLNTSQDGCILSATGFQVVRPSPEVSTWYGIGMRATVEVPPGFGSSLWNYIQVVDITMTRVVDEETETLVAPNDEPAEGHDGGWSYSTVSPLYDQADGKYWATGEDERNVADTVGWNFISSASSYDVLFEFQTFAMFLPEGSGSQNVPLRMLTWYLDGDFVKSGTVWAASGEPEEDFTLGQDIPPFPDWSRLIYPEGALGGIGVYFK